MSGRTLGIVVLALIAGLAAAVGVQQVLRGPTGAPEEVGMVFALEDLNVGDVVSEAKFEVRSVPKSRAPEDAISKKEEVIDRTVRVGLLKGDPITERRLAPKGSGRGLAALIKPGMRAFTIQTPNFEPSLIRPGNRVDVLWMSTATNLAGATPPKVVVLLQNVEILPDQDPLLIPKGNAPAPASGHSVTIQVTPEQLELLVYGQSRGAFHLSPRSTDDKNVDPARPVTLSDLGPAELPAPEPAKVAAPPPPLLPDSGFRSVTVPLPGWPSLRSMSIEQGSHVDVLLTPNKDGQGGAAGQRPSMLTLAHNVKVLHVFATELSGAPAGRAEAGPQSATLQATPEDALNLLYGQQNGVVSLVLRNAKDQATSARGRSWLNGLMPEETKFKSIRTLRGASVGADRIYMLEQKQ